MDGVLLVSTFEGGFQPMSLAAGTAVLNECRVPVSVADTYVKPLEDDVVRDARLVAFSVPLFDSLRAALPIAKHIREVNPSAHVTFFGQYATINAPRLAGPHGDSALMGEWEIPLARLACSVLEGDLDAARIPGLFRPSSVDAKPFMPRRGCEDLVVPLRSGVSPPAPAHGTHFRVPDRRLLPPLAAYAQPQIEKLVGKSSTVGGTEITRGCHHKCTYCSVFAAFDGKVFVTPEEVVVDDVRQLVQGGMTHLTFVDAEFFNSKSHGIKILRRLHREFPDLTYDFTTRIDHLVEHRDTIVEMQGLGVKVITSALEFPSDRVLEAVAKEFRVPLIEEVVAFMRTTSIRLNPTFVMFNPWVSLEEIIGFHDWVEAQGMADIIDPIQYETRLHLYKGSPLLQDPYIQTLALAENEFHYEWAHPDPRVDELYRQSVTPLVLGEFKRCCLKC